jgi:hypothetical protein
MASCGGGDVTRRTCPGPFHGRIPFPLPVPCDTVHLYLGLVAGAIPRLRGSQAAATRRRLTASAACCL